MKLEKRKKILGIAEKLFNRFGIKKTGVDEIAKLANVAKGTIYNYFGDKEGLIRELIKEKISSFEDRIEKAFSTVKDPIERLKVTLVMHLKVFLNNPFISDKMLNANNEEKTELFYGKLEEKSKNIIKKIMNSSYLKKLPKADKKTIINTIGFALKGMDETIKNRLEPISIKKFEKDIDFLINAILPKNLIKTNGK